MKCEKLDADIIVIDSYDDADHRQTNDDRTSIVSSSLQFLTPRRVASGFSTSNSLHILTWQQMIGLEKSSNMKPILDPIYKRKGQTL